MHLQAYQSDSSTSQVLVYSPEETKTLQRMEQLRKSGYAAISASSLKAAFDLLLHAHIPVCLIDSPEGNHDVVELHQLIQSQGLETQLVLLQPSDSSDQRNTIPAARFDAVEVDCSDTQLRSVLFSASERATLTAENHKLQQQLTNQVLAPLVCHSRVMQEFGKQLHKASQSTEPLVLTGPRGTALKQSACAVHQLGAFEESTLSIQDCQNLTLDSLEQQIISIASGTSFSSIETLVFHNFNHFTTAEQTRLIQCLVFETRSLATSSVYQAAFPRIIITVHTDPVENNDSSQSIADTWSAASQHQSQSSFIQIDYPPLKDRAEDLPKLAKNNLSKLADATGLAPKELSESAQEILASYHWPENELGLERALSEAFSLCEGQEITASDLEPWLTSESDQEFASGLTLKEMERKLIEATFNRCNGNREQTALALQIGLRTLSGKLRDYGYPPRGGPGSNKPRLRRAG